MSLAIIYQPTRNAMQSGTAKTKKWCLEYRKKSNFIDPVMGWTGSDDMLASEVALYFETQEQAEQYAKKHGIEYEIIMPQTPKIIKKSYVDNYKKS